MAGGKRVGDDETLPASQPSLEATLPVAGAPGGPKLPLPRGDRSRYAFADEVARGGMGRIVRAEDRALGRPVAIKELILGGDDARSRFVREALVTSRLQHPAIVPVYDAGTWPSGEPYYAMKLVAGRSLADVLRQTETAADRLALVPTLTTVAEAMAYAHSRGIIHRDLKPANILVGEFGETVVIDWGLAKAVGSEDGERPAAGAAEGSSPNATVAGTVMGTPAYMAPEQARGQRLDERADVYALGAILYHVLSGTAPFTGDSADAVLAAVLAGPEPDLVRAFAGVPADLVAIVRRAMARDPAARYPSARELAAELEAFQKGQLIASHRYTLAQRLGRFLRKNRTAALVATILLLVLAVTALVSVRRIVRERDRADALRIESDQQRAEAVRFRKDAEERASALTLQQARTALATDATAAVAWLLQIPESRPGWGAARIIATGARASGVAAARLHQSAAIVHVAIMPDGHTVLMQGSDRFWLRDLDTGQDLQLKVGHLDRLPANGLDPMAVLAGGKTLVYARGGGLGLLRLDVRRPTQLSLDHHGSDVMEILPGDRSFKIIDDAGVISTFDLAGTPPRLDRDFAGQVSHFAIAGHGPGMALAGDGGVFLFEGHRQLSQNGEHYGRVVMSDDGQWVAAIAHEPNPGARVWNVLTGRVAATFDGRVATDLAFSPDNAHLAVANGRLLEVELGSGEVVRTRSDAARLVRYLPDGTLVYATPDAVEVLARGAALRLAHAGATDFAELPDGRIVTVGSRGDLRVWDVRAQLQPWHPDPSSPLAKVSLSRDGGWLMSSRSTDAQPMVDVRTPEALRSVLGALPEHLPRALKIAVDGFTGHPSLTLNGAPFPLWRQFVWDTTPDGTTSVVVSEAEGLVARSPAGKLTLLPPPHEVTEVALSGSGTLAACAVDHGDFRLFELPSGRERMLPGATGLTQLALSGSGRWLAAVSHQEAGGDQLVVHATDTGQRIIADAPPAHGGARRVLINQLALSPDGRRVAAAVDDGYVRIWLLEPPRLERTLDVGTTPMRLAYFADGASLAIGGADGKVRIAALGGTAEPRILRGPSAPVTALAVEVGGDELAAGSEDGKVWLWDVESGEGVELWWHPSPVAALAFGPAGLVSASKQGGVRLLEVSLPRDARALRHDLAATTTVRIDADDQAWTPP